MLAVTLSAASAFSFRAAPAVRAPLSFSPAVAPSPKAHRLAAAPQMALRPRTLVLGFFAPRKPLVALVITLALAGIAYVVRKNKSEVTVRPAPAVDPAPPPRGSRIALAPNVWMEQTLQRMKKDKEARAAMPAPSPPPLPRFLRRRRPRPRLRHLRLLLLRPRLSWRSRHPYPRRPRHRHRHRPRPRPPRRHHHRRRRHRPVRLRRRRRPLLRCPRRRLSRLQRWLRHPRGASGTALASSGGRPMQSRGGATQARRRATTRTS